MHYNRKTFNVDNHYAANNIANKICFVYYSYYCFCRYLCNNILFVNSSSSFSKIQKTVHKHALRFLGNYKIMILPIQEENIASYCRRIEYYNYSSWCCNWGKVPICVWILFVVQKKIVITIRFLKFLRVSFMKVTNTYIWNSIF